MDSVSHNAYNLEEPRERYAVDSLIKIFGPRKGRDVWRQVCESCGFHEPRQELSAAQLSTVADRMCRESGLLNVVGQSLRIRLMVYTHVTSDYTSKP